MKSCVVIPARHASTRLPSKMLLSETGLPMVQHTYQQACQATRPSKVIVATDHQDILTAVENFGGEAVLTDPTCASGTDRVAEIARAMPEVDIFVNVQGDEPEVDPAAIDRVVEILEDDLAAPMSTVAAPLRDAEKLADPAVVKVILGDQGQAIYFSRCPIPFYRNSPAPPLDTNPPLYLQHMGLYAYRRDFLLELAEMKPSMLEQAESLEQLRVLEAGLKIAVGVVPHASAGIDTPEDYAAFVARQQRMAA